MNLLSSPGGKEFWEELGYVFGHEYGHYVEKKDRRSVDLFPLPKCRVIRHDSRHAAFYSPSPWND